MVQQWAVTLASSLKDFHRQTCLPAIDGLIARQKDRLEVLGVPGLDEEDEKGRERVRRIMGVLEAGLEE